MTIYKPDGTPYAVSGNLTQFDATNPDHDLFNLWDQEAILIGGSPLFYYEVFIQFNTIDQLYLEDRGKIWSPNPIQLYGYYEPVEPQNPSTAFGIDGIGDALFECNYRSVLEILGHVPKRGSRIQTPHLNEFWLIVDTRLTQFQLWGALHLQLICERFQENITDVKAPLPKPDYSIF